MRGRKARAGGNPAKVFELRLFAAFSTAFPQLHASLHPTSAPAPLLELHGGRPRSWALCGEAWASLRPPTALCTSSELQGGREGFLNGAHLPADNSPRSTPPLQNILGLAIAVLLIAFHYVTAEPRRQA